MEVEIKNPESLRLYTLSMSQFYMKAAEVVHAVCEALEPLFVEGKSLMEICELGDKLLLEKIKDAKKEYKMNTGEVLDAGIMFPTCVSPTNCLGSFSSPIPSANIFSMQDKPSHAPQFVKDQLHMFKSGDVIKLELGAQFNGCIATTGQTIYIRSVIESPLAPITGKVGDALCALHLLNDYLYKRVLYPGIQFSTMTKAIRCFTKAFGVNAVRGSFSNNLQRYSLDGDKVIANHIVPHLPKPRDFCFEENEVYLIDLAISTGEGHLNECRSKPSVFRCNLSKESTSNLTESSDRLTTVCRKILKTHTFAPFSIRWLSESCLDASGDLADLLNTVSLDKKGKDVAAQAQSKITRSNVDSLTRMACDIMAYKLAHLFAFPIHYGRDDEAILRLKTTVIIKKEGPVCLSRLYKAPYAVSEHTIDTAKVDQLLFSQ